MSYDIFQQKINKASTKLIDQNINLIGAAAGGVIVSENASRLEGDIINEREFVEIGDPVERNAYDQSAVTDKDIGTLLNQVHKNDIRFEPVLLGQGIANRLSGGLDSAQPILTDIASGMAEKATKYMVNRAIGEAAAVAQITGAKTYVKVSKDTTGGAKVAYSVLYNAMRGFGDQFTDVSAIIMHSSLWFELLENDVFKNAEQLFTIQSLQVLQAGPGMAPIIVSDVPALAPVDYTSKGKALICRPGAMRLENTGLRTVIQDVTGQQNLAVRMQTDGEFLTAVHNARLTAAIQTKIEGKASLTSADALAAASWELVRAGDVKQCKSIMVDFEAAPKA
jgi:hypothetical protein